MFNKLILFSVRVYRGSAFHLNIQAYPFEGASLNTVHAKSPSDRKAEQIVKN